MLKIYLLGNPDKLIDFELLCDLGEVYGFSPSMVLTQLSENLKDIAHTGTPLKFRGEIENLTPTSPNWENSPKAFLCRD